MYFLKQKLKKEPQAQNVFSEKWKQLPTPPLLR